MKKALKVTFLYIGTAIGAGFSSGKELALFFGAASPLNVALSSVFMSLLCLLFLLAGKLRLVPKGKAVSFMIFFSAGISLVAMLAGSEFLLESMTGVPMLGVVLAILGGVIVAQGIEGIKLANSVLVPLIVLSVAIIFFKLDAQQYSAAFSIWKPIAYSGLDVLLGGVIVSEEGEKLTYGQIFATCGLICAFLFGMLFMLQTVVLADGLSSSMPVLFVAERFGLKPICGALILAAIFTTLVSSLKIVSDKLRGAACAIKPLAKFGDDKNRALVIFGALLVAYPISFVGFDAVVDTMYPVMSYSGIALTAIVAIRMFIFAICKLKTRILSNRRKSEAVPQDGETMRSTRVDTNRDGAGASDDIRNFHRDNLSRHPNRHLNRHGNGSRYRRIRRRRTRPLRPHCPSKGPQTESGGCPHPLRQAP